MCVCVCVCMYMYSGRLPGFSTKQLEKLLDEVNLYTYICLYVCVYI